MWRTPSQIQWRGEKPIVYISEGTHGCYPTDSIYWRLCGLLNEHVSSVGEGIEWTPKPIICEVPLERDRIGLDLGSENETNLHETEGTKWLQYAGDWGSQGTLGLRQQDYWDEEVKESNTCFQRMCCWVSSKRWSCRLCQKPYVASPTLADPPKESWTEESSRSTKRPKILTPLTLPT
eukprot:TRINITY_DN23046_c0_g1_i2.p1 TRINITY_DN23046_c0_g1~~TRINITY_DN23046_c0_g1_i2.p1  ORF type:complete len:178 (+),score=5.62 TRINITY_DN23046_c0_g1_i2:144-677(+)